jgi:hypothetical protein
VRSFCPFVALLAAVIASQQAARFSVDGVATMPSTAVATIQPRTGAPEYSWLRIYFYPALPAAERLTAEKGLVESIRTPWAGVLQFTVDKNAVVWQIDLSLPGHTCTIADSDTGARKAFDEFRYDGRRLRLKGKGSYLCTMTPHGTPSPKLEWDVDVELPVIDRRQAAQSALTQLAF